MLFRQAVEPFLKHGNEFFAPELGGYHPAGQSSASEALDRERFGFGEPAARQPGESPLDPHGQFPRRSGVLLEEARQAS